MMERGSLQQSRGSLAAQLFKPSGRERFGRRDKPRGPNAVRDPAASENALALPESSYRSVMGFRQQEGQIQQPRKETASGGNRDVSQR